MKVFNKYEWAESDVTAGMIVCRAHRGPGKWFAEGWRAKWTMKVGFIPADGGPGHYCLIAMTDGMVTSAQLTKKQLAEKFTREDMVPMPWGYWQKMVKYLKSQTNPRKHEIDQR